MILCYNNKDERDEKISYINQYGINTVIDDLASSSEKTNEFNKQRQLRKVYHILTMTIE